jgi:hypothetical protein
MTVLLVEGSSARPKDSIINVLLAVLISDILRGSDDGPL